MRESERRDGRRAAIAGIEVVARWALVVAVTSPVFACSDSVAPSPDGAIVVGDALPPMDADPADAATAPDGDATSADLGIGDGGPRDALVDAGFPDAGTICDEPPVEVVTATAVADRAPALDGRVVSITGTLVVGDQACTDRACPPDDPCCNTCTAPLTLGGATFAGSDCFASPGCTGTTCGLVCQPPDLGLPGRYRGILRAGPPLSFELIAVE